jgi:tetratricopeptide (TPR) repeat protein
MSLLLEALKKAEKAKEEAQRKANGDSASVARSELGLQPEPSVERRQVVTRSQLPDIHQPLEILSDDLAPSRKPEEAKPAPSAAPKPRAAAHEEAGSSRATARKVFEAKFKEPNPRLPFYLTLGALGLAALGIVVYFWYQLRPPQLLVNPNPAPSAQMAAAPAAPGAPRAAAAPIAPAQAASAGIPGLPAAPVVAATEPASAPAAPSRPAAAPAPRGPKPSAIPFDRPVPKVAASTPRPAAAQADPQPQPQRQLSVARPVAQVHPRVEAAYAAFIAGDVAAARAGYEAALRDEPANRDALLGLAATEVRTGRLEAAEAIYARLLRADPRDPHAQAGMLGVRSGRIDPLAAESRVKTLLATDPGAHVLHFALGNQLAQQGRWPEAQQHYFKAYSADPEQPDFAFNLAVSLDHLRQYKLARQYYERALALAGRQGAAFDLAGARERIRQLAE